MLQRCRDYLEANLSKHKSLTALLAYTGDCTSEDVEGVVLHIVLIIGEVVANVDQALVNLEGPQGPLQLLLRCRAGFMHAVTSSIQGRGAPGSCAQLLLRCRAVLCMQLLLHCRPPRAMQDHS